ncbi:MAG: flavodoxin-dependent (E)-4-hydroxy-3-methylbut-2-enyl-diphosphate synthase [Proteobacteria bacterium]|nr:flavodoxin-dependent (E)-4-hydroxy-3-methylbut-2-enyl-diphosphate synthase [Pseudomonadota bacterium]
MIINRKKTRQIYVGNVAVGGTAPITIQSMTNTDTRDISATVRQIKRLEKRGCEIIRVAIPDNESARAIKEIKRRISIPLIADIHFDYKLALESIKNGADCIRINPGNIKNKEKIKEIIKISKDYNTSIRIGVNSGSLDYKIREKFKNNIDDGIVFSAIEYIKFFEDNDFFNIKVSLKSTDILTTISAYEKFSQKSEYPLHIGITEAGTEFSGTIKSAIGIGYLLIKGIGDTLRVSLTANPEKEIDTAKEILKSLNLRRLGPILISCPTCARREIDVIKITKKIEKELKNIKSPIKIAIMGCEVNGPGEARDADIGIAGSITGGIIFKEGRVLKRIEQSDKLIKEFIIEIKKLDEKYWRDKKNEV